MIPWTLLDTAEVPGGGLLKLLRRGDEFSIKLDRTELMNSRLFGSEEALATLAAARIAGRERPRVLVGGLGMGFTMRAALAALPADAEIVVVELVPAVIAWANGPLAEISGRGLDDPRITLVEADVAAVVAASAGGFDAILLDVDNGPDGLSRAENDGLYATAGLGLAERALRPGGVLAVWSSGPDAAFARRLRKVGFAVEEARPKAGRGRGARHIVWLATKPGATEAATPGRGAPAHASPKARAAKGSARSDEKRPTSGGRAAPRPPPKRSAPGVDASGERPLRRPTGTKLTPGGPASPRGRGRRG